MTKREVLWLIYGVVVGFVLGSILLFWDLPKQTESATPEEALQWLDYGILSHSYPDNEWNRYWIETYQAAKKILWEQFYKTPYPEQVTALPHNEVLYRLFWDSLLDQSVADNSNDPKVKAFYTMFSKRWIAIINLIDLPVVVEKPVVSPVEVNNSTAQAAKMSGMTEKSWVKLYGYGEK